MNFGEPSCGVLYVATGRRHLVEAARSAESVRKHMPRLPILLYTDQTNVKFQVFTEIRKIDQPQYSFGDKILPLKETPFERTLFLDTDTHLCAPVHDLFEILDRFDLAASHAPYRPARPSSTPSCFCELNSGVIAYRRNTETICFFDEWMQLYQDFVVATNSTPDQPALRQALYESSIRIYILPPEYNLRTVMPGFSGRGTVKILHGRGLPMQHLENWINGSQNIRVFLSSPRQLTRNHLEILSPKGRYITAVLTAFIQPWIKAESILRPWKRRFFKTEP
ncbi:MAG: hypothetical protein C5B47_05130 [Verrucomicrobia bacterium]|nr:MAG: hypothetical protein C5B47_05130 [Verrucomicrobiota bacterium]